MSFCPDKKEAGFTLIETVVGIGIAALVVLAIFTFQMDILRLNRIVEGGLTREAELRKVLKNFAAELRGASTSSAGDYLIQEAATSSLTFFADIDNDGSRERIRYFLSGAYFKKGIIRPSGNPLRYNTADETLTILVANMAAASTIFSYYGSSYDGATPPLSQPVDVSLVRVIEAILVVDPNGPLPPSAVSYNIRATIRNLRYQ